MAQAKTITRISPAAVGLEESERHYLAVHVPLARSLLPRQDSMLAYSTLRVRHQRDAVGGWQQRPEAWRFIVLRFDDSADTVFPDDTRRRTAADHVHCLKHLRRTDVDEQVLLDRLCGQTALRSFLIEVDASTNGARTEQVARARALAGTLVHAAGERPGIRRVVLNLVLDETETEPMAEPGQLLTDRRLPQTDKLAYLEVVADDSTFGRDLLAHPEVDRALRSDGAGTRISSYEVDELCGFDRRG